jgi:hypothetical protein
LWVGLALFVGHCRFLGLPWQPLASHGKNACTP